MRGDDSPCASVLEALSQTPCPFAGSARGHLSLPAPASLAMALRRMTETEDFVACPLLPAVDVSASVHAVLLDLAGSPRLYDGIETHEWTLRTDYGTFFPMLMSPSYPSQHPRHLNVLHPVLVLQSEESFSRRGISSTSPRRAELSVITERSFCSSGREYFAQITRELPKAFRVIKPFAPSEPPVRWWETPPVRSATSIHQTREDQDALP